MPSIGPTRATPTQLTPRFTPTSRATARLNSVFSTLEGILRCRTGGLINTESVPILCAARIAGCLLVSSTQYNYVLQQARLALIEDYANLLALAFEPEEFYEPYEIELRVLPNQEIQKKHFANFRQRVANTMMEGV